jgi:hypothetical protein
MHFLGGFSVVDDDETALLFLESFVTVMDSGRCSTENFTVDDGDGGDRGELR